MSKKRTIQAFDTHKEADEANKAYYKNLTTQERLNLALKLMKPYYDANPRFERVFRTAELGECPVSTDWRLGLQSIRRTEDDG